MSLTLGLTGMDPATEAALKAAFNEANARLGERWTLVPDGEATHVVVDMDSMYGPMSWLRLHAAGRQVIGLTSAPRSQTDFRLGRPFDIAQVAALLAEVAKSAGVELQAIDAAPVAAPVITPAPAAEAAAAAPAGPRPATPPPAPAAAPAAAALESAPQVTVVPAAATLKGTGERSLADWLQPGAISGRVRFQHGDGPALLIDTAADSWHGPTALKSAAPCFEVAVDRGDLAPVDDATWFRETAEAGPAQPLTRLRWLGGLLAGKGELLPGFDPQGRFLLNKWPQTEREYPRHFRIATQMMKGPATVAELAEASGVPAADVADFVNANLATGFAEPATDAAMPADDAARQRGGLLGRLRSR